MRYIHVFVSSTFSDMHRERDLLHQIAGLINRDIFDQGYQIILRDLRYGIDTSNIDDEREIEKKVLSECFEAINQCQLFVLLMGDRYGSVFEDLSIPRLYMPTLELKGKSVTHLEVDYGMLKIDRKHILAFERKFIGDPSVLPPRYQENETNALKQQQLKKCLCCNVDTYSAEIKDGTFVIDEYYFLKHGQAFLQQMVSDYIREQEQIPAEAMPTPAAISSETLSEVLIHDIEQKTAVFPEQHRKLAEELILLRIQDLLHQEDYERINLLGSDGNTILEYRRSLIAGLPDDLMGLLQKICTSIAAVVDPALDVFSLLQILAFAQNTQLSQMGGISTHELQLIQQNQQSDWNTLEEWLNFRYESSGLHFQQSPAQRALGLFLGKDTLLFHTEEGYLFRDSHIAELLYSSAPAEYQERIWAYLVKIFWYLPDAIGAWVCLLDVGRYDLALSCLKAVGLDDRFTTQCLNCVETAHASEQAIALLSKFLHWMIRQSVEEVYILYILELSRWIVNCGDDETANQQYLAWIVPLYQDAHYQYYEKNRSHLTVAGQYLLWHLYNEFQLECPNPPPPSLSTEQMGKMEDLDNAIFELFRFHDLSNTEEWKEHQNMAGILAPYFCQPEQVVQILQLYMVRTFSSWNGLCENMALLTFANQILDQSTLLQLLSDLSKIHYTENFALNAIEAINQALVEYADHTEDNALCISALHIVYDIVSAETRMRRTDWVLWSYVISCDVIFRLYRITDDAVVREIAIAQEELMFVVPDELSEMDASFLQQVDAFYKSFRNTAGVFPDESPCTGKEPPTP